MKRWHQLCGGSCLRTCVTPHWKTKIRKKCDIFDFEESLFHLKVWHTSLFGGDNSLDGLSLDSRMSLWSHLQLNRCKQVELAPLWRHMSKVVLVALLLFSSICCQLAWSGHIPFSVLNHVWRYEVFQVVIWMTLCDLILERERNPKISSALTKIPVCKHSSPYFKIPLHFPIGYDYFIRKTPISDHFSNLVR